MIFHLKQYDTTLLTFEYENKGIEGQFYTILEVNEEKRHLLPQGLNLTHEDGLLSWLKRRIAPKNRAYVDTMLARMGYSQRDTIGIIQLCKGLSVIDSYWVVEGDFDGKFADFNLFENTFESALALVAYTGYGSVKAKGFTSSPEFTTNGMLPKAWRRMNDKIYLYKGGTMGGANTGNEPYSEFYAAQVAHAMGLCHIPYGLSRWKGGLCSTCEIFTDINTSYVHIYDFVKKKPLEGIGVFLRECLHERGEALYTAFVDMLVFDALICNTDRHYGNFGLLVDNASNTPISFAPLFDHGLSLFNYAMDDNLQDFNAYALTRISSYDLPFLDVAKAVITDTQKEKLHKMRGFTFTRHSRYNLPAKRLKAIERFLQHRMGELLALPSV